MSKRNVYKGHRYVPKIMGEWNQEETYEGLSIVTNKGTSYTSKKRVPVGIDILDEEYWVVTGNYNAQVENYRQEVREGVRELDNRIRDNTLDINTNKLNIEKKADKEDVEVINQQLLTNARFVDSEIERLDQKDEETDIKINGLNDRKREKGTGLIFISDYKKLENETDDEHINRVLASIPLRKDGYDDWYREGTLVLESKDYILKDSIVLGQYQGLHGAGRGTRLKFEDSTAPIIQLDNNEDNESLAVYGVSIENVSLWGSNANIGIKIINATHLSIRNVYIYNTIKGIEAGGIWLGHFDRLTIRNYHSMGEYGFHITGGASDNFTSTSLLFNNTWVKNFKRGYDIRSALYSSFNSTACDTFTHFAYSGGAAVTYNSVGAEDGNLIDGGCVFQAGARPVVYNTPNVMNITYKGAGEAYIFHFTSSLAEINGFRWQAGTIPPNLKFIYLGGISRVDLSHSWFPTPLSDKERFTWDHKNSNILERSGLKLVHFNRFHTNIISDLPE